MTIGGLPADPKSFIAGPERERAVESLTAYMTRYTGRWFDTFADAERDAFSPPDIVAVSTLSVDIPPEVSIWLLGDGRRETELMLTRIPKDTDIWHADASVLGPKSDANQLWDRL